MLRTNYHNHPRVEETVFQRSHLIPQYDKPNKTACVGPKVTLLGLRWLLFAMLIEGIGMFPWRHQCQLKGRQQSLTNPRVVRLVKDAARARRGGTHWSTGCDVKHCLDYCSEARDMSRLNWSYDLLAPTLTLILQVPISSSSQLSPLVGD